MNAFQLTGIDKARKVNHKICDDIFMNASAYTLEFVTIGFQIYALKSS